MDIPSIWFKEEASFRSTINLANNRAEALKYVHKCAEYFIDAGCTGEEVDRIELIMKNIVREWAHTRFGIGSKEVDTDLGIGKDIRNIKYFNDNQTYVFHCLGRDAEQLKKKLVNYESNLLHKRKGGDRSFTKKFLELTCYNIL